MDGQGMLPKVKVPELFSGNGLWRAGLLKMALRST
jgi:hypothetical protein